MTIKCFHCNDILYGSAVWCSYCLNKYYKSKDIIEEENITEELNKDIYQNDYIDIGGEG